jgi:hypothetical protein
MMIDVMVRTCISIAHFCLITTVQWKKPCRFRTGEIHEPELSFAFTHHNSGGRLEHPILIQFKER